jgi:microcystin-dependent protein
MSFTTLTSSLFAQGKANVRATWLLIRSNFADHQARINALEQYASLIPVGTIVGYGSSVPPTGYLACNGATVNRVTYANLFAVIGERYGAGDGVSTFLLPDFRGRCPIGAGTGSGLTARTTGTLLGEETHVLTTPEIPSHNHTVTDPGHVHQWAKKAAGGGPGQTQNTGSGEQFTASAVTGITINNAGSGTAHNNMQPFLTAGFLIKY